MAPELGTRAPGITRRARFGTIARRPALGRLIVAFACFRIAELGAWISVTTLAYSFGGVDEAGAVMVAQLAPAALAALVVHRLADHWGAQRVHVVGLVVQAGALALVGALAAASAPPGWIYTAAVVAAVAVVTTRPTMTTLLVTVVNDPLQLTAANAMLGAVDGLAMLVGPLIAAVAIGIGGTATPFAVFATLTTAAAVIASAIPVAPSAARTLADEHPVTEAGTSPRTRAGVRAVLVVLAAHSLLLGALDVLYVVIAVDVTGGTSARAAWLGAAFGAGALLGGGVTALLVGRHHLWPAVTVAGVGTAATLVAVSVGSSASGAAIALAACGAVAAVLFVAARTLLQRLCDLETLCRAFSIAESCEMTMLLVGALVVPFFVRVLGAAAAPIGIAVIMAFAVLAATWPMAKGERSVDDRVKRVDVLRSIGLFASLPPPTLETLAREAGERRLAAGDVVISEGDVGDRFYVVTSGTVVVRRDGETVAVLGAGHGFGELALLHDAPRNATVVCVSDSDFLTIERAPFLVAVTGAAPRSRTG